MSRSFHSIGDIVCAAAALLLPPEKISVSECAERHRYIYNPGSFVGKWKNDTTPYLVEPMDMLTSREHEGLIFVGPAQCGKTELPLNWIVYSVVVDPADMYIYQTSGSTARDFSNDKVAKLHRYTEAVKERIRPGRASDNTYDKFYRSGTRLKLSWPSINEMSGHSTGRLALTDYDRMAPDVDGEGSPFFLARKRSTSFGSFGMTLAESSPGFSVLEPNWRTPKTNPHMAPPCEGILALYNQGDRRLWYWECPHCHQWFEPKFSLLEWPRDDPDIESAAEQAMMHCPHCAAGIEHKDKFDLNRGGRWLREGHQVVDGEVVGRGRTSSIVSYWLKGVAASFASWKVLVSRYIRAMEDYETTGSHEGLKTTTNTDLGEPFVPPKLVTDRTPDDLERRSRDFGDRVVPEGIRFLTAQVDIQKGRFVVQVQGWALGLDTTIIDRFDIVKSKRIDEDGDRYIVSPGTYLEDWDLLLEGVIHRKYPLDDGSGRSMQIKITGCDSGGRAGVTEKAYGFYRKLKKSSLDSRFILIKGASNKNAPRLQVTYPDADRKDRKAGARGEIPIMMLNTNSLKDSIDKDLERLEPGGGMVSFPDWLPNSFYQELCAEQRDYTKGWTNPLGRRNESWDLMVYGKALVIKLGLEKMNWDKPYRWCAEWDLNSLIVAADTSKSTVKVKRKRMNMADWAKKMG